jgi:hypothetical protein
MKALNEDMARTVVRLYLEEISSHTFDFDDEGNITIDKMADPEKSSTPIGDHLVAEIVNDTERTMTISAATDKEQGNYAKPKAGANSENAYNGTGCDAYISLNPESKSKVPTESTKGSGKAAHKTMPTEITGGHELIHGWRIMNGKFKGDKGRVEIRYYDALKGKFVTEKVKEEDAETIGFGSNANEGITEQGLRSEQGYNRRMGYGSRKPSKAEQHVIDIWESLQKEEE